MKKTPKAFDTAVKKVALRYYQCLDTPVSLGAYLRLKYECWDELVAMTISPMHYLDATSVIDKFRRDYAAVNLLRKYEGIPLERDLDAEALQQFYEAEAKCKMSNLRLSHLEHPIGVHPRVLEFLHALRKTVKTIVGSVPDALCGRYGPGTAFEFDKCHGPALRTVCGKLTMARFCTPWAADVVRHTTDLTRWTYALCKELPQRSSLQFVQGNRFTAVPKNATTKRGICIEPGAQIFTQLGAGEALRSRLHYVTGIDILDAQDLHQLMAMEGSREGSVATVDVKTASDTIAYMAVKLAFGYAPDWFSLLDQLRSPKTRVRRSASQLWKKYPQTTLDSAIPREFRVWDQAPKGKRDSFIWKWLEKFSSMGNGFTFELETILFYAIAIAASGLPIGHPEVKVYGDDIIVPTEHANAVVSALQMFGFTPNEKKTFLSGPFRESCGGDFFMGERVTPFYLKTEPLQPSDWITIANALYAQPYGLKASLLARRSIGLNLRVCGPRELGDVVLHEKDPRKWSRIWRNGDRSSGSRQVGWVRAWVPIPSRIPLDRFSPEVMMASALYGVPSSGVTPRDEVSGYRYRWLAFS